MLAYQQNAKQNGEVFQMQKLVIKNIGQILSGKREEPLIEADCLVAVDGKIEIRPVMFVALSYDHRVIDGQQSVSFLVKVKENLENPARMLLS